MYNIEVDEFHTYFVGELGAWVHNKPISARVGTGAQNTQTAARTGAEAARGGFTFTTELAEQGAKIINVHTPAGKALQVAFNEVRDGTTLILRQAHIQGAAPGEIGVSALKEMVRQYGRQEGAAKVIVEGARRTTSSMAGKTPRPWVIDVF